MCCAIVGYHNYFYYYHYIFISVKNHVNLLTHLNFFAFYYLFSKICVIYSFNFFLWNCLILQRNPV